MNLAGAFVYKISVVGMNTRWGGLCEFLPPSQSYPSCSKCGDRGSAREESCVVHRRRLGIDLSAGLCSLSFNKDAGHSLILPKAAPGRCMKVPNPTVRFDGSLEGNSKNLV